MSFQVEKLLKRKTNTRLQLRYDFNKTILSQLLVPGLVLPQDQNVHLSTLLEHPDPRYAGQAPRCASMAFLKT
jgi:hypothetical protein